MNRLNWQDVRGEFVFDGCLLDIYLFETDWADWEHLLNGLRTSDFCLSYFLDGKPAASPTDARQAFADREAFATCLSVGFGGVIANTFFFTPLEIEFDIDPREITGQDKLDALIGFMSWLAARIGKEAVLTPENCPESIIFRVRAGEPPIYNTPAH